MTNIPQISKLDVRKKSRVLHLSYANNETYELTFELLRVYSPSAEVKGHGPGQEVLQFEKQNVQILSLESIGNYAVRFIFDDGHDSGIYSWQYLYELCKNKSTYWEDYLARLNAANKKRLPETAIQTVVEMFDPKK